MIGSDIFALQARFFRPPPWEIFAHPQGGGEIFPEGGENPEESYKIGALGRQKFF